MANRVEGLTDAALLDCFISGLKYDVKREVLVQAPTSFVKAVALAKLYDAKPMSYSHPSKKPLVSSSPHRYPGPFPASPSSTSYRLLPTPKSLPSTHSVKRLTAAEMQVRRDRGLCYTCDEKFSPGHRCPNRQFLFLLHDDDPPSDASSSSFPDVSVPIVEETVAQYHHLSHCAFHGASGPSTLRFRSLLCGHDVQILLDSGSSDNFIQPRLTKFLHLPIEHVPNFKVLVGNGHFLTCEGYVKQIPLSIQGHTIHLFAFLLLVTRCEHYPWCFLVGNLRPSCRRL